ncbi:MAG: hypothetical protein HQL53_09460 [Magnetococcales bacterium]|nr:hypothetical protein [Magnetococcales bacterium]
MNRLPLPERAFPLLAFVSGMCGIAYEVLLGRALHNLLGDGFAVTSAILLSFMLGIGLGARLAHGLWRRLWLIEIGIGLSGAAIGLANVSLTSVMTAALGWLGGEQWAAIALGAILLLGPALLIGCSMPLFAGYDAQLAHKGRFAAIYALYNLGAALTVLVVEFGLLRIVGIQGSLLVIATINLLLGAILFLGLRQVSKKPPPKGLSASFAVGAQLALILGSIASAVFQLTMARVAEFLMGPFRETFALVLAIVLGGIALGSALARAPGATLERFLLAAVGGCLWILGGWDWLATLYARHYDAFAGLNDGSSVSLWKLVILAAMMGPAATAFGGLIPAMMKRQDNVARESGHLLFLSATANAAGFALTALVLHSRMEYGQLLFLAGSLPAAAWLLATALTPLTVTVALASTALLWGQVEYGWREKDLYLGYTAFHSPRTLKKTRRNLVGQQIFKSSRDVVSLSRFSGRAWLFFNGYKSISLGNHSEVSVGTLSAMLAPRAERALVLGLGTGKSASAVGKLFAHTDVVEINPVIIGLQQLMSGYNLNLPAEQDVTIHQADGLTFVRSCPQPYDLVVNTVTTPLYFSSDKLYTHDFLQDIRQCLTPDGVYMTWMDSRVREKGARIILKTLQESFDHIWLAALNTRYFLLFASLAPLQIHGAQRPGNHPALLRFYLEQEGLQPEWLPHLIINTDPGRYVRNKQIPINTLDKPTLSFAMSGSSRRGFDAFNRWLIDQFDPTALRQSIGGGLDANPLRTMLVLKNQLGASSTLVSKARKALTGDIKQLPIQIRETRMRDLESMAKRLPGPENLTRWARWLAGQGECDRAIPIFQEVLIHHPKRNNIHLEMGICYERMGRRELAAQALRLELKQDPWDADALHRLGTLEILAGNERSGVAMQRRALALTKKRARKPR